MLVKSFVLVLVLLSAELCLSFDLKPVVTTSLGKIQGYLREFYPGEGKYEVYEGIPYALPPIGNRRFSPPEPIQPWEGTLVAEKLGNECIQYDRERPALRGQIHGTEDCLFLNIFAPLRGKNRTLPVVVWIHGGAFQYGDGGSDMHPHYLVKQEVLMVGINYRLGSLGFLSTEDDIVPGNMGLKDQSMALRWIKTHIKAFGGDPTKITIVGLSAGGASVHYHYLSPMSTGLFHSGMSFSGTALDCWTQTENSREKAVRLAELVDCPTSDVRKMIECMKKRPAQDLVNAQGEFMPWMLEPFTPFGPVVEKNSENAFIDRSPIEIIASGDVQKVPWITGVVSEDGLYPVAEFALKPKVLEDLDKNWESIAPLLLDYYYTIPVEEHANVARKIRKHYFGDKPINYKNIDILTNLVGDRIFIVDAEKAAKTQAKVNPGRVWFFYYSYRAENSASDNLSNSTVNLGVCHGDDVMLAVGNTHIDPVKRKDDYKMHKELLEFWLTVAHTGVPEFGPEWAPIDVTKTQMNYLHMKGPREYGMKTHPDFAHKSFWNSIDFDENNIA